MKQLFKNEPLTMGLLLLNFLIFLVMQVVFPFRGSSPQAIFAFGGLYGDLIRVLPSESWRLLSSNFVHIGIQHLLMNSFSLYIVGRIAEQLWRREFYLLIYVLSGVFGGVLTLWLSPSVLSAGASSSIFGLFAAVAVLGYIGHHPLLKQTGKNFQSLIAINLLFNLFMPDVNIWGHLGGAIGGCLLALALPNRVSGSFLSLPKRFLAFLTYFILLCLMLMLFFRG